MKNEFLFLMTLLCLTVSAQDDGKLKKTVRQEITDRFPSTRVFNIQYQQYAPTDFDSELFDKDFQKGEINNHSKLSFAANIPIYSKPRWTITSSVRYKYETFETKNVTTYLPEINPLPSKMDYHYLSAALSFTYYAKLFNKPFIYNVSVIGDGTEKDAERVKAIVGGSIILKRTERTTIGVGLVVFIDPTSQVPLAPTFIMNHTFLNSPWTLDIILPQRVLLTRPLFANGKLSLGTELIADGFYTYSNQPGFADVYDYRQLEINSGVTYEHVLHKDLIATFKVGLANVFSSRASERGKSTNDYIFSSKQDGTAYFNLGFSYNPFLKKKKK